MAIQPSEEQCNLAQVKYSDNKTKIKQKTLEIAKSKNTLEEALSQKTLAKTKVELSHDSNKEGQLKTLQSEIAGLQSQITHLSKQIKAYILLNKEMSRFQTETIGKKKPTTNIRAIQEGYFANRFIHFSNKLGEILANNNNNNINSNLEYYLTDDEKKIFILKLDKAYLPPLITMANLTTVFSVSLPILAATSSAVLGLAMVFFVVPIVTTAVAYLAYKLYQHIERPADKIIKDDNSIALPIKSFDFDKARAVVEAQMSNENRKNPVDELLYQIGIRINDRLTVKEEQISTQEDRSSSENQGEYSPMHFQSGVANCGNVAQQNTPTY